MSSRCKPDPRLEQEVADADVLQTDDLPAADALVAGTLALMTAHAQACCDDQRALMAQKAAASLWLVSQHPLVAGGVREMAGRLQPRWAAAGPAGAGTPDDSQHALPGRSRALWHTIPEVIQ